MITKEDFNELVEREEMLTFWKKLPYNERKENYLIRLRRARQRN